MRCCVIWKQPSVAANAIMVARRGCYSPLMSSINYLCAGSSMVDDPSPVKVRPQVIFLMGPTASGKTDLAIALRQYLPVELISVDSALVYRGMDIGTAKPTSAELTTAPHRLI